MNTIESPTTCPRHPKVETNLRCATCGTLICPKCLVQTPVGAKCKSCTAVKGVSLVDLSLFQAATTIGAGLLAGVIAGFAVVFHFGWLTLLLAFAYGRLAGSMILRASGRKRGAAMELLSGTTVIAGILAGRALIAAVVLASRPPTGTWPSMFQFIADLVVPSPIPLIALIVVVAGVVGRIRYV